MLVIFCNSLVVADDGMITGYALRQQNGKFRAVQVFASIGFKTIAAGDSFNDLAMLNEADAGFLFRASPHIAADNPAILAFATYGELLGAITAVLKRRG
jgi:phosphoserine/homoserine phosphotransferase